MNIKAVKLAVISDRVLLSVENSSELPGCVAVEHPALGVHARELPAVLSPGANAETTALPETPQFGWVRVAWIKPEAPQPKGIGVTSPV